MRFAYPYALCLLVLLPLLWAGYRASSRSGVGYSLAARVSRLPESPASMALKLLPWLRLLAVTLAVLALARPQWGVEQTRIYRDGISIAMVVDVSSSMSAPDLSHTDRDRSRLDVVKETFRGFVRGRGTQAEIANDRIGMVSFARFATVLSPLTVDHNALLALLEQLRIVEIADEDGTAVGDAIATAVDLFKNTPEGSKVMILLTDGANNAGESFPVLAAEAAKAFGVRIYTIGAGTRAGDPSLRAAGDSGASLRTVAHIDEETLVDVARTTGGRYFRATDGDTLRGIYAEIDRLEKSPQLVKRYQHYVEGFPLLALLAALALVLEQIMKATWLRVVSVG